MRIWLTLLFGLASADSPQRRKWIIQQRNAFIRSNGSGRWVRCGKWSRRALTLRASNGRSTESFCGGQSHRYSWDRLQYSIFRHYSLKHAQYYFSILENWTRLRGEDFKCIWLNCRTYRNVDLVNSFISVSWYLWVSQHFIAHTVALIWLFTSYFAHSVCMPQNNWGTLYILAVVPVLRPAKLIPDICCGFTVR